MSIFTNKEINNAHLKVAYFMSNIIIVFLLIAPISCWGTACDVSVSSEEGLRSALASCGGGTIHLDADISASQGEFSYMSYGWDVNLKVDGNGHSISVPEGSEWRILRFGGVGVLTLENITLANGTALGLGGAVYAPMGSITVIDSVLTGNRAVDNPNGNGDECAGGAIYGSGPIRVVRSRIIGNQAGRPLPAVNISCGGGAIAGGSVTITDSTLSENSAGNINNQTSGYGGAVLCRGPCSIADSIIINNTSYCGDGGGIYAHRDLTITNSTIKDNKAFGNRYNGGSGGGIFSASHNFENIIITQSTISGNQSSASGGVFYRSDQ